MQIIVQHWQEIVAVWISISFLSAPLIGRFAGFNQMPID